MPCRLCSEAVAPLASEPPLDGYERCASCGYVQLRRELLPTPEAERARYLLHRNDPAEPGYRAWLGAFMDAFAPYLRAGVEILDFGSGPVPALGSLAAERGYGYAPYDPFFAPGGDWRSRTWDAIAVHEVAEHLAEPAAAFAELAAALAPGGVLAVRTRFQPAGLEGFARWRYRQDSTHVGFFTPGCLSLALHRLGLSRAYDDGREIAIYRRRESQG